MKNLIKFNTKEDAVGVTVQLPIAVMVRYPSRRYYYHKKTNIMQSGTFKLTSDGTFITLEDAPVIESNYLYSSDGYRLVSKDGYALKANDQE